MVNFRKLCLQVWSYFQLIEVAGEYDQRSSLRPIEFVDFVEQKPVSESSPDPIRVMTIHQSKGLEFDVVVLPSCTVSALVASLNS